MEDPCVREDYLEVEDGLPQAPVAEGAKPDYVAVDRSSDRAGHGIHGHGRKRQTAGLGVLRDVMPGRAPLYRDRARHGVEGAYLAHLAHVEHHAATVRDGAAVPSCAAPAGDNGEPGLVAQLNEGRDFLRGLRQDNEIRIEPPLQEGNLREGGEVVAVDHAVELRTRDAFRSQCVHETAVRVVRIRQTPNSRPRASVIPNR